MMFKEKNRMTRFGSKIARSLAVRVAIMAFISILLTPSAMLANC